MTTILRGLTFLHPSNRLLSGRYRHLYFADWETEAQRGAEVSCNLDRRTPELTQL